MKLFIFSHGDESVGLNPQEFEIQCPFEKDEVEDNVLAWFAEIQLKTYRECLDIYVKAAYDFQLKEMY
jgi:hypothetical protein